MPGPRLDGRLCDEINFRFFLSSSSPTACLQIVIILVREENDIGEGSYYAHYRGRTDECRKTRQKGFSLLEL